MSEKIDPKRRKALLITSGVMGAVTVAGFAVPFLSAWNPSEKAKAMGQAVQVACQFIKVKCNPMRFICTRGDFHQTRPFRQFACNAQFRVMRQS